MGKQELLHCLVMQAPIFSSLRYRPALILKENICENYEIEGKIQDLTKHKTSYVMFIQTLFIILIEEPVFLLHQYLARLD